MNDFISLLQGRVIGITVGCLIGMFPLLFIKKEAPKGEEEEEATVVS